MYYTLLMKINHVTLLVRDKQKAEQFYTQQLGFEKKQIGKSLWLKIGSDFIHISQNADFMNPHSFQHFAIEVDNVYRLASELISKGVEIFVYDEQENQKIISIREISNIDQFFIKDPDGNLIEFINQSNSFFHPS